MTMYPPTMNLHRVALLSPLFLLILLAGCLTVESKEYHIRLRTDHSGEATITFINIMSESDDTLDNSQEDFQHLVDFYLQGSELEKQNPGFRNVRKRLYEEDGMLNGELTLTFDSLAALRLFKFDKNSPYMYFVGSPLSAEQFVESNGTFGRDWMPVVFWEPDARELYVKTRVVSEVTFHTSLLPHFKGWQAKKESDPPRKGKENGGRKSTQPLRGQG
jgi:hypothetical protein